MLIVVLLYLILYRPMTEHSHLFMVQDSFGHEKIPSYMRALYDMFIDKKNGCIRPLLHGGLFFL